MTTPDVLALRGVRRMRELWKRLGVREDEDVKIVLNRASRRREIQPDLARKVVGEHMVQRPSRPTSTRSRPRSTPARRAGWRTASCAAPSRRWPTSSRSSRAPTRSRRATTSRAACSPASAASAARPRSSSWACSRSCSSLRSLLWQIALTGYTYVAAGHAAREGARELATDPTDAGRRQEHVRLRSGPRSRTTRPRTRTSSARGAEHSAIELRGDVTVSVRLRVPLIIPGIKSPLTIGSTADTVLEDGELTDRQDTTPLKGDFGEDGNWN